MALLKNLIFKHREKRYYLQLLYLLIMTLFSLLWFVDTLFDIANVQKWIFPLVIFSQVIQLLLIYIKVKDQVVTASSLFQILFIISTVVVNQPMNYHIMVFWLGMVPLVIVISTDGWQTIFWYIVNVVTIIALGLYAYSVYPFYLAKVFTANFIVVGTFYTIIIIIIALIFKTIENYRKRLLELKSEEIRRINESLTLLNDNLEKRVLERTSVLMEQQEQFQKFAFVNSHIVRAPLASLLGLINLFEMKEYEHEHPQIVQMMKESGRKLDDAIREMTKLINEDEQFKKIMDDDKFR